MLVASLLTHGVIGEIVSTQAELRSDELQNLLRDQLPRRQNAPRVAQRAKLQRVTVFVMGTPSPLDVSDILVAESVMDEQFRLVGRQAQKRFSLPRRQHDPARHACSFFNFSYGLRCFV